MIYMEVCNSATKISNPESEKMDIAKQTPRDLTKFHTQERNIQILTANIFDMKSYFKK